MAQLSKIRVGQTLYTVSRGRLGNTTLRTVRVHPVTVEEVNLVDGYVIARWNHNRPEKYRLGDISTWKVSEPVTIDGMWGAKRLASREEKAAILAKRTPAAPMPSKENKNG